MMNSPFMLERARALAKRLQETSEDNQQRIEQAYALLYGRKPSESELQVAIGFLESDQPSQSGLDRWQQYCQVLLSANEFMFVR